MLSYKVVKDYADEKLAVFLIYEALNRKMDSLILLVYKWYYLNAFYYILSIIFGAKDVCSQNFTYLFNVKFCSLNRKINNVSLMWVSIIKQF